MFSPLIISQLKVQEESCLALMPSIPVKSPKFLASFAAACEKLAFNTVMIASSQVFEISPPAGLGQFFRGKAPKLWGAGDPAILNQRLLGIISARQIDSDLALKSSQLLKELASLDELAFVGGWHSPLEEEAFHVLLVQTASIVFCVPKALHRIVLPGELENRVRQGQILLLTHCSPKAKRISRDASLRRNQL